MRLLIDGPCAYEAMLDVIANASRWIHFENYIIRADDAGWRFAEALARRAREGVHVRVLYDGLGSWNTRRAYWRFLRQAGVEVRPFRPLSPVDLVSNFSRNHRKLVVADGARAVIGGLCIGCEWTGEHTPASARGATPQSTSPGRRPRCWIRPSRGPGRLREARCPTRTSPGG